LTIYFFRENMQAELERGDLEENRTTPGRIEIDNGIRAVGSRNATGLGAFRGSKPVRG